MDARLGPIDHFRRASCALEIEAQAVEQRHVADRGAKDDACRNSGSLSLGERSERRFGVARRRGIDRIIERERRGVGDHRLHVGEPDALVSGREQHQLVELGTGRQTIRSQKANERVARIGIDGHARAAQRALHQAQQIALGIGIAGYRRGGR